MRLDPAKNIVALAPNAAHTGGGTVRKQRYIKGGAVDLRSDVTRAELSRLQKDLHNVLWSGAKMEDTDVFNNLLKMLIAKIYDEQTTEAGKPYRFQTDLKDGSPETATEILAKVSRIYRDALRHYFRYTDDVLRLWTLNTEKFKPEKVAYVMERLEDISLIDNKYEDDVLGAFFEGIVRTGFKQQKGQFFTHSNVVRFMLHALEVDEWVIESINDSSPRLPYIIDPSCGSGTFLIEAMKLVTHAVLHTHAARLKKSSSVQDSVQEWFQPAAVNKNSHNRWAREFVYGIEDNEDLAMATKVNMILHGVERANIEKADGLAAFAEYHGERSKVQAKDGNHPYTQGLNEQFDFVISNPPFSLKEDDRTLTRYGLTFAYADRKNSENLFIERWYQLLKEGGRLGVVLPDSVFDTNENLYIRLFLYRFFDIRAVVSLPVVTFQPYTPTKTSVLFAAKKSRTAVEAWDRAWRVAASAYGKLRKTEVVQFVLRNERLRNALIDLANKVQVDWYPATNLLAPHSLPAGIRAELVRACESDSLKKRCGSLLLELDELLKESALAALERNSNQESTASIRALLRDRIPQSGDMGALSQLVDAAYDEIVDAAELNFTEDPKGQNYCNAWWCFAEIAGQEQFRGEIFFGEAEQVGFKRTSRHPEGIPQDNHLFAENAAGEVLIDTARPKTVLDALRAAHVFSR